MNIPRDVILIWPGNHSNIPANWVRETLLDGKFVKSHGIQAPNITGGNATHTHSSSQHTHAMAAHTHTGTVPAVSPLVDRSQNQNPGEIIVEEHTHAFTTGALNNNNNFGNTAVTYAAVSNNPPYYEVIFIKADTGALIKNDMIAYFSGATPPDNWYFCNGANSTPDLRNKYLRGAATAGNAGASGGSTTNVHNITHGHSAATHDHSGFTTSTPTGNTIQNSSGSCCSVLSHTHTYGTTQAASITPNNYTGDLTTTETVEPLYKKLLAIQKKAGVIKLTGIIGLWLGDIEDIPVGWALCDGNDGTPNLTDYYVKVANTTGEIGNTGGSNTHTHGPQSHSHTVAAHSHLINETKDHNSLAMKDSAGAGGNYDDTIANDTHPTFNTDNASPSTTSATTTGDLSNNEPEYRTAAYIMLLHDRSGSAGVQLLQMMTD